jgi:hypothetical protein
MQGLDQHSASGRSVNTARITAIAIDALEELRALVAPGLDGAHGLIFGAGAHTCAAIELGFSQIGWKIDRAPQKVMLACARHVLFSHCKRKKQS